MLDSIITKAYKILDGEELSKELVYSLSKIKGSSIIDLISLANKVNIKFAPPMHICTIMNAKSGLCSEDCKFCAQSSHYETEVETFPLKDIEQMLEAAKTAYENGVRNFGLVASGYGLNENSVDFKNLIKTIDQIHAKFPDLSICASIGMLNENAAKILSQHHIKHYNINYQTVKEKYRQLIATSHSPDEKKSTIKNLKKYGIKVCSGGILGLGETMEDRVEFAFQLKEEDVDVIPLNVLIPIKGTPLENQPVLPASEIAVTFAIFRLVNPTKIIKFAAGRETKMNDFQGLLMLSGANGFLTGGYLTTRGRDTTMDLEFKNNLKGFRD